MNARLQLVRVTLIPSPRASGTEHHHCAQRGEHRHADKGGGVVTLPFPDAGDRLSAQCATVCLSKRSSPESSPCSGPL